MLAAILALFFGAGPGVAAQDAAVTPTIAIVEFPRPLRFIGLPQNCASPRRMTPDFVQNADEEICADALYEGRAVEIRHLAGPRLRKGVRMRLIAHNLSVDVAGQRFLIMAVPFDDDGARGFFALARWSANRGDDFCFDEYDFNNMADGPFRRIVAGGYRRRFDVGVLTDVEHFCIPG